MDKVSAEIAAKLFEFVEFAGSKVINKTNAPELLKKIAINSLSGVTKGFNDTYLSKPQILMQSEDVQEASIQKVLPEPESVPALEAPTVLRGQEFLDSVLEEYTQKNRIEVAPVVSEDY